MRMTGIFLLGAGLLLSSGCATRSYAVTMSAQPSQGTNYVILQENRRSGRVKVYDCRSMPDGQNWEPTCVEVKFK